VTHNVVFAPEAIADLRNLYDLIADASFPARALTYVEGLRLYCLDLADFPERGIRRDAIRPGLRTIGYKRRMTVAFHVKATNVVIDRLLYGGRDFEGLLREEDNND